MKTTLKYNTIETFQRQPAWKKFIDTIVDNCKGLYDDHLVAEFEDGENVTKDGIPISNIKLSESNEGIEPQIDLTDLQPKYPVLNYLNDGIPLTMQENISLRGLLKTLCLYGCKIKDVELYESGLPHTYKKLRNTTVVDDSVWGFEVGNSTHYNYQAQATVDGVSGQEIGYTFDNESLDSYHYQYEYIKDIFGYNQKNPVLIKNDIKEVKEYYCFELKSREDIIHYYYVDHNISGLPMPSNTYNIARYLPQYLFVSVNDVVVRNNRYIINANNFYRDTDSLENSGVLLDNNIKNKKWVTLVRSNEYYIEWYDPNETIVEEFDGPEEIIDLFYDVVVDSISTRPKPFKKWVKINDDSLLYINETSYIITDKAKEDMVKENGRIEYNSSSSKSYYLDVNFALSENSDIEKVNFERNGTIGSRELNEQTSDVRMTYYVYKDSKYGKEWIVLDSMNDYTSIISLPYLKEQIYSDECALKAQPLFLYKDNTSSLCANLIDTVGGENKITFEIEKYNVSKILNSYSTVNNASGLPNCIINGIHYGDYYYKWEQYNKNNMTFIKNVYAALNFSNDNSGLGNKAYFFDESKNTYAVSSYSKSDNTEKEKDDCVYLNTNKQEYFETMYFNHFIKVYPIDGETDGNLIKTNKLYCDNLELVEFGDIVPYVVSYDRKGVREENTDNNTFIYNDIDCAIFSKILSYNKRTHLLIVDGGENGENKIWFNDSSTPKYVVVAYQNASPFNKIKSLNIVTSENVSDVVSGLIKEYENNYYDLNLYPTETDYKRRNLEELVDAVKYSPEYTSDGIWGVYDYNLLPSNQDIEIKFTIDNEPNCTYWAQYGSAYREDGTSISENSNYNGDVLIIKPSIKGKQFQAAINVKENGTVTHPLSYNKYTSVTFVGDSGAKNAITGVNLASFEFQGDIYGLFTDMVNLSVIKSFKLKNVSEYRQMVVNCPNLIYFGNDDTNIEGSVQCVANVVQQFDLFKGLENILSIDTSNLEYKIENDTTSVIKVDMTEAFKGCISLKDLKLKFNSNNKIAITCLDSAFEDCEHIETLDLSNFDLSQLVSATDMVKGCSRLNTIIVDKDYPSLKNYVGSSVVIKIK